MATESTFDTWLSDKLSSISPDIDLEVFVSYFTGILDTDSPNDEKEESMKELLADLVPEGIPNLDQHCLDILKKWNDTNDKKDDAKDNKASFDEKLASIMEKQKISVTKPKSTSLSKEEKERKAAILAQYSQVQDGSGSDGDEDEEDEGASCGYAGSDDLLSKNVNAAAVDQREKLQREKMKEECDKKKQKDKEDREKQKAKAQERKDQEKKRTQKGERRR